MRIVVGLILIVLGFLMVWKTEPLVRFTGYNSWAEAKMGTMGGTRMLYKLIGILLIFFGMLAVFNLYNSFLSATIGTLLGGGRL